MAIPIPPNPTPLRAHRSGHRALTLLELLTVVAIVSLLAALLIPSIGKARISAGKAASASSLRDIGVACFAYAADHDGYLPEVTDQGSTVARFNGWAPLVQGGYTHPKVFTSKLSKLSRQGQYWAMDGNGTMSWNTSFPPGETLYPLSYEAWEFSAYGDLSTVWGTRGKVQRLNGNAPLGLSRQKMAWSYEWDIPLNYGFGHILYLDGHVSETPTKSYAEWADFMGQRL